MPTRSSGKFVRIPFYIEMKCYIKSAKEAKKLGRSFSEFICDCCSDSIFTPEEVDSIPAGMPLGVASRRKRK